MTYTIHTPRLLPGAQYQTTVSDKDEIVALFYADTEEESARLARRFVETDALIEALRTVAGCCHPEAASLYDEEAVEGWKWTHEDGREWTEIGDWLHPAPIHPVAQASLNLLTSTLES